VDRTERCDVDAISEHAAIYDTDPHCRIIGAVNVSFDLEWGRQ